MKKLTLSYAAAAALSMTAWVSSAQAQVIISEVAPFGSSATASNGADWFELTNAGSSAVNISGWKMDDNSNSSALAVALSGVTSIAAGQSVVFVEVASGSTAAAVNAAFTAFWFGSSVPSGFAIGNYGGSGVGLGTGGDAVNIYDASGALQANVVFNTSAAPPTFDNAAGLNNTTVSALSVTGTNGAFVSANALGNVGSPGSIATVASVPEAEGYAMALAGLGALGLVTRRRKG
jgi:MYXO-CTERM domain-containing protein